MSSKFKVGDTVRRTNTSFISSSAIAAVGQVATVIQDELNDNVRVSFKVDGKTVEQGWYPANTELLSRPLPQAAGAHARKPGEAVPVSACSIAIPTPHPLIEWVELRECARTYHFPDGSKFVVEDAIRLCVRPSGHRLETAGGRKFIVPGKFIVIEIHANDWSA
jgi:hypothetical protein